MIWDILTLLLEASVWILLVFVLRSEKARCSQKHLYIIYIVVGVFLIGIYLLLTGRYGSSFQLISWLSFGFQFAVIPLAIAVYPHTLFKNLFLLFAANIVILTGIGLGNCVEFVAGSGRFANIFTRFVVEAAMLGAIYGVTKRKFPGLYDKGDNQTWFSLFVITLLLGAIGILSTGFLSVTTTNILTFIPARLCLALVMLAIFYISGLAQEQAEEAANAQALADASEEAVRQKEENYARIVDHVEEMNRLRHDLRQMFTVMQGLNEPDKEIELEAYCLEVLSQMHYTGTGGEPL
jgi:signal transduction histidine kinase